MKAIYNNVVVAEADKEDLIFIEGNWYFSPDAINSDLFEKSDTPYTCPWKGKCQYYNVTVDGKTARDSAFTYPEPLPTAIDRVKKDSGGYYAFWGNVQVTE